MHSLKALVALACTFLISTSARADIECKSGKPGPCYEQISSTVRKDFAGSQAGKGLPLTPQAIADDLSVPAPAWGGASPYEIYFPSAPKGRLVVFAPGSPDVAAEYQEFGKYAASLGFHVLVLRYWNTQETTANDCVPQAPPPNAPPGFAYSTETADACITKLLDGQFRSSSTLKALGAFTVPKATPENPHPVPLLPTEGDPFQNRLRRALTYLERHFPQQHWKQFSANSDGNFDQSPFVSWSKITLAGHSSGSKLLAYVAQQVEVHSLIMLSGPNIGYPTGKADEKVCPTAISHPSQTSVPTSKSHMYAYYNLDDDKSALATACHQAMGLGDPMQLGLAEPLKDSLEHYKQQYKRLPQVIVNEVAAVNGCKTKGKESSDAERSHLSTACNCALREDDAHELLPSKELTLQIWKHLLER
ncbi:MAG TPA: hypothetical protein VHB79_02090 [Polyangiaceae bacterium]|nr:hypothetical protein [Polyangiaceae bacterium]